MLALLPLYLLNWMPEWLPIGIWARVKKLRDTRYAIVLYSCRKLRDRQAAAWETWMSSVPGQAYLLEGGYQESKIVGNSLQLACDDSYPGLSEKTASLLDFAASSMDFEYLVKADDDTYVHVERLLEVDVEGRDYIGVCVHPPLSEGSIAFAAGGLYILSAEAVRRGSEYLSANRHRCDEFLQQEDRLLGETMHAVGISFSQEDGINHDSIPTPYQCDETITCHWIKPEHMRKIHVSRNRPQFLNRFALRSAILLRATRQLLSGIRRSIAPRMSD